MLNIKNIEQVLSHILSERHNVKINVKVKKEEKENDTKVSNRK